MHRVAVPGHKAILPQVGRSWARTSQWKRLSREGSERDRRRRALFLEKKLRNFRQPRLSQAVNSGPDIDVVGWAWFRGAEVFLVRDPGLRDNY
jgi:hypothetical protein